MRDGSERDASDWCEAHTHTLTHTHTHTLELVSADSKSPLLCHWRHLSVISAHTHTHTHTAHLTATHRKLDLFVQRSVFEKRYQNSSRQTSVLIIESFPDRALTFHLTRVTDMNEWCLFIQPMHVLIRVSVLKYN